MRESCISLAAVWRINIKQDERFNGKERVLSCSAPGSLTYNLTSAMRRFGVLS